MHNTCIPLTISFFFFLSFFEIYDYNKNIITSNIEKRYINNKMINKYINTGKNYNLQKRLTKEGRKLSDNVIYRYRMYIYVYIYK